MEKKLYVREYDRDKVCLNCALEGEELNLAEYPVTFKHRAWRPCLYRLFNLYFCPRCGAQYYDSAFFPKRRNRRYKRL